MTSKVSWSGTITSVQPRIRLLRSFDQISHAYLGYSLRIEGTVSGKPGSISIGIGKAAQEKHRFQVGDSASGQAQRVENPDLESVEFYKVSKLQHVPQRPSLFPLPPDGGGPPWVGVPPDLETYRARGHRRLEAETYSTKCSSCLWGCNMAVEMTIDHWNPTEKRYRTETMCYGPLSCPDYKKGAKRKVPGRRGLVWIEEDWIDKQNTEHRGRDE